MFTSNANFSCSTYMFYFSALPWTVSRQAAMLRCHTGHSRLPVPGIVFKRFTQGSRRRKVFTDMLKAEKCTSTTCVNVSAWTMHLHQECVATVQLLSWRDLERLCAITFNTSHMFDRLDYVISLYIGSEFTWEKVSLIYLQLWENRTERVLAKIQSFSNNL